MLEELLSHISAQTLAVPVPTWLELSGLVVGSVAGALEAQRRDLDLIGYLVLAMVCGMGGGLVRDMMMQKGGVYMLDAHYAIPVSLAASLAVFLFPGAIRRHPNLLEWADIVTVGLFAASGTYKALEYGFALPACLLMGCVTGVGGGLLRDVLLGEVPLIFIQGNFYVICAIGGASTYWGLAAGLEVAPLISAAACVLVTVVIRRLSLRYHIVSPTGIDLTPSVERGVRRVTRAVRSAEPLHMRHRASRRVARRSAARDAGARDVPGEGDGPRG